MVDQGAQFLFVFGCVDLLNIALAVGNQLPLYVSDAVLIDQGVSWSDLDRMVQAPVPDVQEYIRTLDDPHNRL